MGTNEIAAEGPSGGHDSSRSDVGGATQRGPGVGVAGDSEDASLDLSLPADTIHTLVVLDGAGRLRITDLEDAAGSQVRPSGGAATGLGGTAARPGPSPLPWLAVIAADTLLAGAGARRYRQIRVVGTRGR
jgi:hypothetical protein